jgi:predicted metalloprotease with PDZ domain
MAASVAEYLLSDAGQDKQMLIFAGGQHVEYGFGIPRRVFRRLPLTYSIVLPITIHVAPEKAHKLMNVTMPEVPLLPGDFAWIVGYEDLEDQKAYLGVTIRDVEGGVKILKAMKNSAAEESGLQQDDIITAFDGEPVATVFDLTYLISLKTPGDKAIVDILRDEQPLNFEVTLQASPFHR